MVKELCVVEMLNRVIKIRFVAYLVDRQLSCWESSEQSLYT